MSLALQSEQVPSEDVDPAVLFGVMETSSARHILASMGEEPVTASELAARCGIANSTLYRQLGELVAANLVEKTIRIDARGHHAAQFRRTFSEICISLDGGGDVSVSLH